MSLREAFKISIEKAFSEQSIVDIANKDIAPLTVAIIDQRTRRGEFLGGSHKDKPYSDRPLPTWFFGKLTGKGSSWTLRSDKQNTSADVSKDLIWYGGSPYLEGGYRKWRQLTGRGLIVNLTFTGGMLNAVDTKVTPVSSNEIEVEVYVRGQENSEKAYYTNLKREWLGLSDEEQSKVEQFLTTSLDKLL